MREKDGRCAAPTLGRWGQNKEAFCGCSFSSRLIGPRALLQRRKSIYPHRRRGPQQPLSARFSETPSRQGPVIAVPFDGIARYLGVDWCNTVGGEVLFVGQPSIPRQPSECRVVTTWLPYVRIVVPTLQLRRHLVQDLADGGKQLSWSA